MLTEFDDNREIEKLVRQERRQARAEGLEQGIAAVTARLRALGVDEETLHKAAADAAAGDARE